MRVTEKQMMIAGNMQIAEFAVAANENDHHPTLARIVPAPVLIESVKERCPLSQ
jgi:hypothetical protein